jgi:hypothetical protein
MAPVIKSSGGVTPRATARPVVDQGSASSKPGDTMIARTRVTPATAPSWQKGVLTRR